MLSGEELKDIRKQAGISIDDLAGMVARAGLDEDQMKTALRNWERGLYKPRPKSEDVTNLARALGVERHDLEIWAASHRFAPIAPRKARLVAGLINGMGVQEALDVLECANKRAAVMFRKVLASAIANADEQEADVRKLFVAEARVDEGGIRQGTRRWRPKDRGRAMPWTRLCSHLHVKVATE